MKFNLNIIFDKCDFNVIVLLISFLCVRTVSPEILNKDILYKYVGYFILTVELISGFLIMFFLLMASDILFSVFL